MKKAAKPQRFKVTQPHLTLNYDPSFPEQTTRIGSNGRYIVASNHPEWYFMAVREEDRMIEATSLEVLQRLFQQRQAAMPGEPPMLVYTAVLVAVFRDFAQRHFGGEERLRQVLNHAATTVVTNLRRNVFADPAELNGDSYTSADFLTWAHNLEQFEGMDVFTYHPPEQGKDLDGKRKPILEVCPVPRLGRHLVRAGYLLGYAHMAQRFPEAAAFAVGMTAAEQR